MIVAEKVDLATYNAQLLENTYSADEQYVLESSENQHSSSDSDYRESDNDYRESDNDYRESDNDYREELDYETDRKVLDYRVATSTSSAISYADDQDQELTTPMPPPRPRSDKSSQTSWRSFDDVPVNDQELDAVFPQFADAYNQEESQLQADLADLEFVDQSDFAILNQDGSVESFGTADELNDIVYETYETYDDYEMVPEQSEDYSDHPGFEQGFDQGFDLGQGGGGGPTTLMLFNIFSPEEVDFLKDLVGEDAIKELKDDVDVPMVKEDDFRQTLEEVSTPKSRRPPQFDENDLPKNAYPSSQGIVRPDSSIRESLQVYHKSELQHDNKADDLVEEGFLESSPFFEPAGPQYENNDENVESAASVITYAPPTRPPSKGGLIAKADERREKMEALLQKLSERYDKRKEQEEIITERSTEDALDEELRAVDEKADRMKMMIENLKHKLSSSRPGVNTIHTKDLDNEPPIRPSAAETETYHSAGQEEEFYHTTAAPIHIDKFSEMIGEKLRGMKTGIHSLNLDDMLDLDAIQIKAKGEDTNAPLLPVPPPGSPEVKPKREVLHPKLTRQRPALGKAHIPSINLKSYINPATDAPNPAGIAQNQRPIIPRYVDQPPYRPPSSYRHENIPTPQPYVSRTEESDSKVKVKYLPPMQGPRLQGYKAREDPHPQTKELQSPYPIFEHDPNYGTEETYYEDKTEKKDTLPPPLFYSDRHVPSDFNPKVGPKPNIPGTDTVPHLDASSFTDHNYKGKYIPSSTYRNPSSPSLVKGEDLDAATKPVFKAIAYDGKPIRTSKEYAPASYAQYPPPSYTYKQPNIRFKFDDEYKPTQSPPHIQVTPKNVPLTTSSSSSGVSSGGGHTPSLGTEAPKSSNPTRSYAPPPYRPPSYDAKTPDYHYKIIDKHEPMHDELPGNPKAEHISSLSPPARGYVPPLGQRTTTVSPSSPHAKKPYHSPRPAYMSKLYSPRTGYAPPSSGGYVPPSGGYVPPSGGNFISTISPPSHGYSTPHPTLLPHVSSIAPTMRPTTHPTTATYVSSISPPRYGYSLPSKPQQTPHHISTMTPPKKKYESHYSTTMPPHKKAKGYDSHISSMSPPIKGYDR